MTKKPEHAADKPESSSRYRKVEVRTWGDAKFRALSALPPCGQGLWLFLITGPHTGPIPGLFRAGRAAMAEELGWEVEDFDKAFAEALQQGMVEADFKARVVWIPNALKHNKPASPNVVKSWATEFDLIPECDLKWRAFDALKASIHALGEAYGNAFDTTFAKPSGKPTAKTSTKTSPNQEQQQEQEQEQKKAEGAIAPLSPDAPATPGGGGTDLLGDSDPEGVPTCPHRKLLALYRQKLGELPQPRPELWEGSAGAEAMRQRWKWLLTAKRDDTRERYATTVEEGVDWFDRFFDQVANSPLLMGRKSRWRADLGWLMKRENFIKVVAGNYLEGAAA